MDASDGKLELVPGVYHGNYEITGGPFRINFWTVATDIDEVEARERMAFAHELVRAWNERMPI